FCSRAACPAAAGGGCAAGCGGFDCCGWVCASAGSAVRITVANATRNLMAASPMSLWHRTHVHRSRCAVYGAILIRWMTWRIISVPEKSPEGGDALPARHRRIAAMTGDSSPRDTTAPAGFDERHRAMGEKKLRLRGIASQRVLDAMLRVPRHEFVPPEQQRTAYDDIPLAIGAGQTISQPFMVAAMTEALELTGGERVLEVGTGCGYQTAVLSLLAREVFTIETHRSLAEEARTRLT